MTTKRPKNPVFTSPKGTFKFPKLMEADTKFKDAGEFSVKVILPEADAKALIKKLTPLHEAAEAEGQAKYKELPVAQRKKLENQGKGFTLNPFFTPVYGDDEEETGEIEFKFSMVATGEYKSGPKAGQKWSRSPAVFDAKGKPLAKNTQVWGGTVGKVTFEVSPYWVAGQAAAGISLRLQAAQIIDLVSGGQRNASAYGFGEEDGYEQADDAGSEDDTSDDDASDNTTPDAEDDF